MKTRPFSLSPYLATARMCATQVFDGNFLFVFAGYSVRLVQIFVMIAVFRTLRGGGMSISQLMCYTVLSSALSEQLYIYTPATTALWEGSIISRFTRPLPVIGELIAETMGKWVPSLVFYSVPVCAVAALLGVPMQPAHVADLPLFAVSLALGISLGFAIDLLFSAFSMRIKNACWAALMIREALTAILSGSLIPFALFPHTVGDILSVLPFASLAGAPLSIYVGSGDPARLILLAAVWNALLWPACILYFRKSKEQMISFGG